MKAKKKPATVLKLADKRPAVDVVWSPVECLKELIADIEAGKVKPTSLMVMFFEDLPGGKCRPGHFNANMTAGETFGLLEVTREKVLRDWLGE